MHPLVVAGCIVACVEAVRRMQVHRGGSTEYKIPAVGVNQTMNGTYHRFIALGETKEKAAQRVRFLKKQREYLVKLNNDFRGADGYYLGNHYDKLFIKWEPPSAVLRYIAGGEDDNENRWKVVTGIEYLPLHEHMLQGASLGMSRPEMIATLEDVHGGVVRAQGSLVAEWHASYQWPSGQAVRDTLLGETDWTDPSACEAYFTESCPLQKMCVKDVTGLPKPNKVNSQITIQHSGISGVDGIYTGSKYDADYIKNDQLEDKASQFTFRIWYDTTPANERWYLDKTDIDKTMTLMKSKEHAPMYFGAGDQGHGALLGWVASSGNELTKVIVEMTSQTLAKTLSQKSLADMTPC